MSLSSSAVRGSIALAVLAFVLFSWSGARITAQSLVTNVPAGISPFGIAVNTATNRIYVSNISDTINNGSVSVIDGNNNTVIGSPITV
jgi:DNA-binding beta-propeller fold protein YncE